MGTEPDAEPVVASRGAAAGRRGPRSRRLPRRSAGTCAAGGWACAPANWSSLPIVVGLVVIGIVFGTLDDTAFFTERNFTNLLLQMAAIATIAIGVVFVLLIGEIDLSVAFVGAVGGVDDVAARPTTHPTGPGGPPLPSPLVVTTLIGLLQALVITKAGVQPFVVTLAGLLIWSGVVLVLTTQYSTSGTIRIEDDTVVGIANNFLSDAAGWVVGAVGWPLCAVAGPDGAVTPEQGLDLRRAS